MPEIIEDQHSIYDAKISRQSVIDELGDPLEIDADALTEEGLIQWINKNYNIEQQDYDEIRYEYVRAFDYSTEQEEHDIGGEISFTIYCQAGYSDAFWSRDSYVEVDSKLYFIDSGGIADTEFFQWRIGYWLRRFDHEEDSSLQDISEKLSAGYGNSPSYELEKLLKSEEVVWSKKRNCFVGKLKKYSHPVEIYTSLY
jgi:hypothetical protein